jgi:hypothetical protein
MEDKVILTMTRDLVDCFLLKRCSLKTQPHQARRRFLTRPHGCSMLYSESLMQQLSTF